MRNPDQQRLFENYNPLEDRLGADFFGDLPTEPGIYKMFGRDGSLLYIGKAKNLRNRLFTYRRAKVGKASRKTIRLIRMVHNIEFELCKDEKEALLQENRLIRQHRPEFNHAKKSPETYYFVHFQLKGDSLRFKLNMKQESQNTWQTFGAFKGHLIVRKALGGLLRLLYIAVHQVDSPHHLPPVLVKNLTPLNYRLPLPKKENIVERELLANLFEGSSDQFFDLILDHFQKRELLDRYIGKLILEDLETNRLFYEKCCLRNNQIVEQLQLGSSVIPQHKLDDYLIEIALD